MLFVAYAGENETFSPSSHSREDLTVFKARVYGEEGNVVQVDLEVLNTKTAYPTRRVFLSENGNLIADGYIVSNIGQVGETITVQIACKPLDADDKQLALVDELKQDTENRYNEIAIPEASQEDISEVLAGFPWVLDWNPQDGTVEAVDIFEPGGGDLTCEPFADSIVVEYIEPPSSINVKAVAQWSQTYLREFDDLNRLTNGLQTFTPENIVNSWPRVGETLGDGILVKKSLCRERVDLDGVPIREQRVATLTRPDDDFQLDPYVDENETTVDEIAYVSTLETELEVEHYYEVRRTESCEFSVSTQMQSNLKLGQEEELEISVQSIIPEHDLNIREWVEGEQYQNGDNVIINGRLYGFYSRIIAGPIFNEDDFGILKMEWANRQALRYTSSFFSTSYGNDFAEYMLNRAKARLKHTGRCYRISFDCEMPEDASLVRTNKTATISSPTLNGGTATGKIVDYTLNWGDGDRYMTVTIACAPGIGENDTMALGGGQFNRQSGESQIGVWVENAFADQLVEFEKPREPEAPKKEKQEYLDKPRFTTEEDDEAIDYYANIPPTKITYSPIIPGNDFEGEAIFPISGILSLPQQVTVQ